ncbi:MAG TPA: ABC transporter permease [Verrucomicrobiae bacterium]|jgi:phospholipid/cholesterol/gamma-HCH transport system permease protein
MANDTHTASAPSGAQRALQIAYMGRAGRGMLDVVADLRAMGAFLLITLVVALRKFNTASEVVHPAIRAQIARAGVALMRMMALLAAALGMVVVGQTVFLLSRYGAETYASAVMVSVVVRELGPIMAAFLVMIRVGAANVVELGTARALGEVEALEALGIDPIHYLVVPRVLGMGLAIFALTIYFVIFALCSGYLFAFIEQVPLTPGQYFSQLAGALLWQDFVLLALKAVCFGMLIAIVTCYEGLAAPMRLDDVSRAATNAIAKCVVGMVLLDAFFMLVYLVI